MPRILSEERPVKHTGAVKQEHITHVVIDTTTGELTLIADELDVNGAVVHNDIGRDLDQSQMMATLADIEAQMRAFYESKGVDFGGQFLTSVDVWTAFKKAVYDRYSTASKSPTDDPIT